jgi:hypothetical protein
MCNEDHVDPNIGYRVRHLVAQTWSLVRGNNDTVQIFTEQLDDMIATSGYCDQGWNNRMIQVLFGIGFIEMPNQMLSS